MVLNLHRPDFSTASNVAEAINLVFGGSTAVQIDASSIRVQAPSDPEQKVSLASLIEQVEVQPGEPPAQVIVNSRTGTVVIGGNVNVTPAVITHGSLTVRIREDPQAVPQSETIIADGVVINTGDLIVGDVDGVVIVPKNAIAEVIARVEEKNSGENLFRNAVRDGMPPSQAFAKYGVL